MATMLASPSSKTMLGPLSKLLELALWRREGWGAGGRSCRSCSSTACCCCEPEGAAGGSSAGCSPALLALCAAPTCEGLLEFVRTTLRVTPLLRRPPALPSPATPALPCLDAIITLCSPCCICSMPSRGLMIVESAIIGLPPLAVPGEASVPPPAPPSTPWDRW